MPCCSTRPATPVARPWRRITGSEVEPGEEEREAGIDDDHQENGPDDRTGGAAADAFGASGHAEAFVAADERDRAREKRRLYDAEPEGHGVERAAQLGKEDGRLDAERDP